MLSEGTFRHNLRPSTDVLLGTRLIDTWRRLANPLSAKPRNAWSSGIRVTATSWPLHRESEDRSSANVKAAVSDSSLKWCIKSSSGLAALH